MSDIKVYKGKLVPVEMGDLSVEEKAKELLGTDVLDGFYDSWLKNLIYEHYEEYYWNSTTETLYKVFKENLDLSSFVKIDKNEDGTYDFVTSFYNGGATLSDMIDNGLKEVQE